MAAIFISATGTEIGKTFVAAGLLAALRRRGRSVAALKPVVSGFDARNFPASDPALLLEACGRKADLDAIGKISPWRFAAPLSPDQAAAEENAAIDVAAVSRFCTSAIAAAADILIIEGIGGLMVPLNATSTVCDLITELKIPLLLVAGTYLGSLSHTLSAIEVADKRGLDIAGLVINETPGATISIAATQASLGHFWHGPVVGLRWKLSNASSTINVSAFEKLADLLSSPPATIV